MLLHASPLDFGGRFGGQNLGHVLPLVCSRFLNRNKQTFLLPLKKAKMASNESETGRPSRKGKASLRATEAGFQITDSPAFHSSEEAEWLSLIHI